MAIDAHNHSLPCLSYFQKSVNLQDWWLTKPQTDDDKKRIGVSGLTCTSQMSRAERCFCSAAILKAYDMFELETVDGICVSLGGYINKEKTLENGFSPEVFDHFVMGFPSYWEEFSPKRGSSDECVSRENEDGEDSIGNFHDMDTGVEDCKETGVIVSNKASSVSSLDERITKTGDECESECEDLLKKNSKMNGLECLTTRPMTNMDSSKKDFVVPENSEIARKDKDNAIGEQQNQRNKSTCQSDHTRESKDDDESTMTSSDVETKSDPLTTTSIKASQNNNNKAGRGKEASKSKRKLTFESSRAKRQHITSLKSTSTPTPTPTANQERYVNVVSFSGKRSRSGRLLLPSLEFWRNQTLVYDAGLVIL